MTYRHDLVHGYQPRWIDGQTVGNGLRDAAGRYAAIAAHLADTPDGFTAVDIGSHSAYFAMRLADEFGARVTALDGNPDLRAVLEEKPHPGVTGDYRYLTREDIAALPAYDVALVLSVLHHTGFAVELVQALAAKTKILFVESPLPEESSGQGAEDIAATIKAIEELGGEIIHTSPNLGDTHNRPLFKIVRPEPEKPPAEPVSTAAPKTSPMTAPATVADAEVTSSARVKPKPTPKPPRKKSSRRGTRDS